MNITITCGPSYEPIDQVRRITNFSTGRLGITLANTFADAGHRVFCLKGEQATDPTPLKTKAIPFSTNDDLLQKLKDLAHEKIDAIFHAAALCDFKPIVQTTHKKIPTKSGNLTLQLEPTTKVLPQLRGLYPKAKIVGWKYELDGSRDDSVKKTFSQIQTAQTNACVLNGAAYGKGFAFCQSNIGDPKRTHSTVHYEHIDDLESLCAFLLGWTTGRRKRKLPPL